MTKTPSITQLEMSDADIEFAERIAGRLGFTQTAYTSTSQLWGLYCLPDHASHRHGCVIKTKELGFLFVADLEDCQLHDLAEQERKPYRPYQPKTGQKCNCRRGVQRDNCPQCEGTGMCIDFAAIRARNS